MAIAQKTRSHRVSTGILLAVFGLFGLLIYRVIHHGAADHNLVTAIQNRDMVGARAALNAGAAQSGSAETVRLLLAHGADARAVNVAGQSPLVVAAGAGNAETVRLLLAHDANARAADVGGATALMAAIRCYSINSRSNPQDLSLRQRKQMKDSVEIVRLLISHGADVNARDSVGNTATLLASGVQKYISYLPQVNGFTHVNGFTVFSIDTVPQQPANAEIIAMLKQAEH